MLQWFWLTHHLHPCLLRRVDPQVFHQKAEVQAGQVSQVGPEALEVTPVVAEVQVAQVALAVRAAFRAVHQAGQIELLTFSLISAMVLRRMGSLPRVTLQRQIKRSWWA